MDLAKNLFKLFKNNGKVEDENGVLESLRVAIEEDQILFIKQNGKSIGFFTWIIEEPEAGLKFLRFENLVIFKNYRLRLLIKRYKNYFKNKYPDIKMFYWFDDKKNKYFYALRRI